MLTPMDIQQKKFHLGIGYDKKDVNAFFEEVSRSFEELYRSNAELKEKVNTLTDGLQNYKSKEAALKKSLMSAEKASEDTKSKADKEAKNIKLEAKNKAKLIIGDAETRLEELKEEYRVLETQYAAYKSNFCSLMKQQFEQLKIDDFHPDAYIDEKALTLLGGSAVAAAPQGGQPFGSFDGDPQMRDESSLGGMANAGGGMSREDLTSTSAVYTSTLGANENFVDPFNPNKDNGRYNPFDGSAPETSKIKTNFTVNTSPGSKSRQRKTSPKPSTNNPAPSQEPKTEFKEKEAPTKKTNPIPTVNFGLDEAEKPKATTTSTVSEDIKEKFSDTVSENSENEFVGDVEVNVNEQNLLSEDTSDEAEKDEFGFEFV